MSNSYRSEELPISKTGARAREQLLEAAGEIFAEKGFKGATSREICVRAGVNLAAVNYHFGGFEALYIATLKEAHKSANLMVLIDVEGFEDMSSREKLRAILRNLITRLLQPMADSWETRLVSRELVIPSFAQAEFIAESIEPTRAFLRSLIGDIIGRPPDDTLVGRCLLTVIAPSIMLSVINRSTFGNLFPDLGSDSDAIPALVNHIERFVMIGLDDVVRNNAAIGAEG